VKFGGGKVIRDAWARAKSPTAGRGRHRHHQRADPRSLGRREGRLRLKGDRIAAIGRPAIPTSSLNVTIVIVRAPR